MGTKKIVNKVSIIMGIGFGILIGGIMTFPRIPELESYLDRFLPEFYAICWGLVLSGIVIIAGGCYLIYRHIQNSRTNG